MNLVLADKKRDRDEHQVQIVDATALHYPVDATCEKLLADMLGVECVADVAAENWSGWLWVQCDKLQLREHC